MPYYDKTRLLVLTALLIAAGVALNIAESALPLVFTVPGAKAGLSNIAILLSLYLLPPRLAAIALFSRIFIASLLTGSFLSYAFFLSLAGGTAGLLSMALSMKIPGVSVAGVSLAGAAAHNTGQILAACLLMDSRALLYYYLPPLLILSVPAGFFTGFVASSGLKLLKREPGRAGKD
jgi:heptaprenyl diphosphate synthase